MTPQLQQAIRLLQLSSLDLQQEIQENLESNPMLELDEEEPTPDGNEIPEPDAENQTTEVEGEGLDDSLDLAELPGEGDNMTADGFEDFATVIRIKLLREILGATIAGRTTRP